MQNLKYYCRQLKLWQISSAILTVYQVTFEHIIVHSANKASFDSLSNLRSYWNERISCQRTIIHISLWNEENVWIL